MNSKFAIFENWLTGHYYGDFVRRLFFAGALVMLIALPIYRDYIEFPSLISIFAATIIGIAAGFTSPRHKLVLILNIIISFSALIVFEYYAVDSYARPSFPGTLVWLDQILAIIFFLALYYSVKTLRGHVLTKQDEDEAINS